MNTINPLANAQFPASSNTWDFIKEMILTVSKLAALGGNNYILSGCIDQGVTVTEGYIIANGELLPFAGGAKSEFIIISETSSGVNSGGINYPGIYTTRMAQFGAGAGQIAWNTFLPFSGLDLKANTADVYHKNVLYTKDVLYTKTESNQRAGGCITELLNIGIWDMDTTSYQVYKLPGNIVSRIKSCEVRILTDPDAPVFSNDRLERSGITYGEFDGSVSIQYNPATDETYINMFRRNLGFFDNGNYKSTSYNRGSILIEYLPQL